MDHEYKVITSLPNCSHYYSCSTSRALRLTQTLSYNTWPISINTSQHSHCSAQDWRVLVKEGRISTKVWRAEKCSRQGNSILWSTYSQKWWMTSLCAILSKSVAQHMQVPKSRVQATSLHQVDVPEGVPIPEFPPKRTKLTPSQVQALKGTCWLHQWQWKRRKQQKCHPGGDYPEVPAWESPSQCSQQPQQEPKVARCLSASSCSTICYHSWIKSLQKILYIFSLVSRPWSS